MSLPDPLGDAARHVQGGGLLAYPTETLWGLGADSRSDEALARLRRWKRRDEAAAISVLVADADDAREQGLVLDADAAALARAFWPGPITLVVRSEKPFAEGIANADGGVGVRCSPHPLASALSRRVTRAGAGPLTATSLNRSGEPPAATRAEAEALCGRGADEPRLLEVEGAEAGGGAPSTVIDTTYHPPRVLRWGAIEADALAPVVPNWSEA